MVVALELKPRKTVVKKDTGIRGTVVVGNNQRVVDAHVQFLVKDFRLDKLRKKNPKKRTSK